MNREPYWDYMGRRLREQRIKKEFVRSEDLCKKEIAEMGLLVGEKQKEIAEIQKTLKQCYAEMRELSNEIHDLKSQLKQHIADSDNRQIKMDF